MIITLDLTPEEADWIKYVIEERFASDLSTDIKTKIARAIERAESFIDDDDSGNNLVTCAGCNGEGKILNDFTGLKDQCYYCSGTGKEYV